MKWCLIYFAAFRVGLRGMGRSTSRSSMPLRSSSERLIAWHSYWRNAATSMQLLRSANCKAWCTLARNLQLILNSGEHGLCLIIGGARRCNGNRAAGRSKLIVDPMRALAQQQTRFGRKIALMTESRSIAS
jgi:hypothetical protein